MMASARMVLPGVVVSLLLSGPALAAHGPPPQSHRLAHPPADAATPGRVAHRAAAHRIRARTLASRHAGRAAPEQAGDVQAYDGRAYDGRAYDGRAYDGRAYGADLADAHAPVIQVGAASTGGAPLWSARYDTIRDADADAHAGSSSGREFGGRESGGRESGGRDSGGGRGAQVGMASWYGGTQWHGRMTSSGERFDQDALTAAHATLPLGSLVRVSTLDGGGTVVVRITDRPGTRRRIIDLSRGAARELGILGRGVAMVSLQPQ